MLKLHFSRKICYNSDMFRSVLITFRELLNIIKAYVKHREVVKYIKIYT